MKIGDIVIPVRNSNSHSYIIGKKYMIVRIITNNPLSFNAQDLDNGQIGNNLWGTDCKLCKIDKKSIVREIKELEVELDKFNKMLEYLNESGVNDFVSSEFMSWYILKIINSDDKDKHKKISRILNTISNRISVDVIKHI